MHGHASFLVPPELMYDGGQLERRVVSSHGYCPVVLLVAVCGSHVYFTVKADTRTVPSPGGAHNGCTVGGTVWNRLCGMFYRSRHVDV